MCFFKYGEGAGRISKFALGFAVGAIKGLWLLALAWSAWLTGYGMDMVQHINQYYPSYTPTFLGGLGGALFGLICGFIFGFLTAGLYNWCLRCGRKGDSK